MSLAQVTALEVALQHGAPVVGLQQLEEVRQARARGGHYRALARECDRPIILAQNFLAAGKLEYSTLTFDVADELDF